MRTTLLSLILLLLTLSGPSQRAAGPVASPDPIDLTVLDQTVQAQMQHHGLSGVSVAVLAEGGEFVALRSYGEGVAGQPMTPQTQLYIGSQSKSLAALAVAQLVEQGHLDLYAPVQQYLPWFTVADPAIASQIKLVHLLHHTSGLAEAGYPVVLPLDASLEMAVRALAQAEPTAAPGERFQYFNHGYVVLALLIEQVSGQSYAAYMAEHIFAPLGMTNTTADPSQATALAQGHNRLFGFAIPKTQPVPLYEISAGYILSTTEDMARYAQAMLHDAGGLVSPAMARRIFTPGLENYALGWMVFDQGATIVHGGATSAFRTEMNLYPQRQRAFVILSSQGHLIDHYVSAPQLARSVEAVVLGETPPLVSTGWSVRWYGWAMGLLVLFLALIHLQSFRTLFGPWASWVQQQSPLRQAWSVALSFVIPSMILVVVYSQLQGFFGYRFNLVTAVAMLPEMMPDLFILMLIGTIPDYLQGLIKLVWLIRLRQASQTNRNKKSELTKVATL
ncbi:MAG: serine hydrolase domain-containing protein [Oscillochloridaceae bacterium umkhey_bin13]